MCWKKYCNTIRNRWQEGRCFVSKQYFVFKPPYESSMTATSILVFHESWYTKPFSDGFWDIETPVKKCFWECWGRGKGEGGRGRICFTNILRLKKNVWTNIFANVVKEICVIFFFSLSEYENLEWDFRGHRQPFLPRPNQTCSWEITNWNQGKKGKTNCIYWKTWIFLGSAVEYS